MLYTLGIDIGSVTSKAVLLKEGREVVARGMVAAGIGTSGPGRVVQQVLGSGGLERSQLAYVVVTGYGRVTYREADEEVSEIACHARGAAYQVPEVRTVIDIGGQDAKVIRLGATGRVQDFVMNEKCAAGTGRFLEVMAGALEHQVQDLGEMAARATERVNISSTCTVFAESEAISHLAAGQSPENIVAGIHYAIVRRITGLASRLGLEDVMVLTGGVAKNPGVVNAFQEYTGHPLVVPPEPQINGALGAALIAFDKLSRARQAGK